MDLELPESMEIDLFDDDLLTENPFRLPVESVIRCTLAMDIELPEPMKTVLSDDDLLTEILFRLPVEPIIRCILVSKRWKSLITNLKFRRRRNLDFVPAAGLFLPGKNFKTNRLYDYVPFSRKKSTPFSRLGFTEAPDGIRVIHSCNGLLLCCSSASEYYIYNPTTHKFTTLPSPAGTTRICGMSLAFDPTKNSHYQVVCVRESSVGLYQIEVYTSSIGAWRITGEPFTTSVDFGNGVYCNNAIHWIADPLNWRPPHPWDDGDSLYFNVLRHERGKMPKLHSMYVSWDHDLPDRDISSFYFGGSCDRLHYIGLNGKEVKFCVYEMLTNYTGWILRYKVDLSPVVAANPMMSRASSGLPGQWSYFFSVCCVVRGEKEEGGSFLVVRIPGKVIRYNLISKTFEKLHEFEDAKPKLSDTLSGFQYIESLCSV